MRAVHSYNSWFQMFVMEHLYVFNSLTTKKQTTKFSSANFPKMSTINFITLRIQRLESKRRQNLNFNSSSKVCHHENSKTGDGCMGGYNCI